MAQLSVREAAAQLGVHPTRVTQWVASGRIRADWVDGPHGRVRLISDEALDAARRELGCREADDASPQTTDPSLEEAEGNADLLARARAVESYTAGLATTAIAPAVSRLVETIEQLIRENGDLREEVGSLKARLEAAEATVDEPIDPMRQGASEAAVNGLASEEWESLRERLDRLSEPARPRAPLESASAPANQDLPTRSVAPVPPYEHERRLSRPTRRLRPEPPWTRVMSWIRGI
jgi:excisionase family DNA binding protein